jgi:hypothetical protein
MERDGMLNVQGWALDEDEGAAYPFETSETGHHIKNYDIWSDWNAWLQCFETSEIQNELFIV